MSYMAIDQYGTTFHGLTHPRKDLMARLGTTHATKMFQDRADGTKVCIGYVIRGLWLTLYKVEPFERAS